MNKTNTNNINRSAPDSIPSISVGSSDLGDAVKSPKEKLFVFSVDWAPLGIDTPSVGDYL